MTSWSLARFLASKIRTTSKLLIIIRLRRISTKYLKDKSPSASLRLNYGQVSNKLQDELDE